MKIKGLPRHLSMLLSYVSLLLVVEYLTFFFLFTGKGSIRIRVFNKNVSIENSVFNRHKEMVMPKSNKKRPIKTYRLYLGPMKANFDWVGHYK